MDLTQEIDSPTLFTSVMRYKLSSLAIVAVFGILAALFSFVSTRQVSATASISLSDPRGVSLSNAAGANATDLTRYTADRAGFARSQQVMTAAAQLDGHITPDKLRLQTTTAPAVDADVIKVTVEAKTPARARDLANDIARAFASEQQRGIVANAQAATAEIDHERSINLSTLAHLGSGAAATAQRQSISNVLTQLAARRTEVGVERSSFGSGVEYIDPARAPKAGLISTNLIRNVLAGLIFGAFVAMFLAWLRASASRVVEDTDVATAKIALPIFGEIPEYGRRTLESARNLSDLPLLEYQFVAGNLAVRVPRHGVIVVAGLNPGDGATTSAANIAAAAAVDGQRVALVDANFRDRGLTKMLGGPINRQGLLNVAIGSASLPEVTTPVTLKSFVSVSVIPVGTAGAERPSLLRGDRLASLFEALRTQYDLVVVDGPPLLSVSDSLSLTLHSDALLVVMRHGTPSTNVERLRQQIDFLGDRAIGFLFTRGKFSEAAAPLDSVPEAARGKARRRA